MDRMPFQTSVFISTGPATTREVKSVRGACECLIDWPQGRRGPIYQTAVRACEAALAHEVPVSCARSAFVGFASVSGILVTNAKPMMPPPDDDVVAKAASAR